MKKVTKDNRKPYIYTAINISVVVIIFAILNLWSVGDFKNYKKISEFRNGLLSKDFRFKQFPPKEFLDIKLYDNFEKYLLVNKSEIDIDDINNSKYYVIDEKEIKIVNPLPEYFDDNTVVANENGEIVGMYAGFDIIGRDEVYKAQKIDDSFPKYILQNIKKYKDWIVN